MRRRRVRARESEREGMSSAELLELVLSAAEAVADGDARRRERGEVVLAATVAAMSMERAIGRDTIFACMDDDDVMKMQCVRLPPLGYANDNSCNG